MTKGLLDTPLLDPTEAAELLGMARTTLNNLRVKRQGPSFMKRGRRILYPRIELERWVERNMVKSGEKVA